MFRCDMDTHSDSVEFSNFMPVDEKFKKTCGPIHDLKVHSDGKFFRITFRSNFKYDATGFNAQYRFTDQITLESVKNVQSDAIQIFYPKMRKFARELKILNYVRV